MSVPSAIGARLRDLEASYPAARRLENDPVRFVHRYEDPTDREITGFLASTFAYGRVALFAPVVAAVLDRADARGGPAAWVRGFDPDREADLAPLYYRFHHPGDVLHLLAGLRVFLERHGSLGRMVEYRPSEVDVGPALSRLVQALREAVIAAHPTARRFADLPRGLRYSLVDPASGSAAKRLLMFARWMVRDDAVDLGVWSHVPPRVLVMPVDTHVHRIARMTGLITRRTADWRAAVALTDRLRALDPDDPVRYDFALAHLGISQGCRGVAADVCSACALRTLCSVHGG